MPWYAYLLLFLAGALLTNAAPHVIKGVLAQPFRTPFSSPPGVGDSSPLINFYWGFSNIVLGCWLLAKLAPADILSWVLVCTGALAMGSRLALHQGKAKVTA